MASVESRYIATAKADAEGRLIEADEVLARLQQEGMGHFAPALVA